MDNYAGFSGEGLRDLLVRGIAAAKAKDCDEARFYLNWVLRLDPPEKTRAEAWFWLSQVSTDPVEQRKFIENVLVVDPQDLRARRLLAILDGKLNPSDIVDPDHRKDFIPTNPETANLDRFTCPHCGGHMVYTPDGQSLICEYCEDRQRLSGVNPDGKIIKEDDFIIDMATARGQLAPIAMHTVECKACGVTYTLPADQMTFNCAYCGSSYILQQVQTQNLVAPSGLIPFKISENQAKLAFRDWLQHLSLKPLPYVSPGWGFYLPVWAYDIGGIISWRCMIMKGDSFVPVSGTKPVHYLNLPVFASKRLPKALHQALDNYDLSQIVPYDPRYLVNWLAETYQITLSDAALDARKQALDKERETISQIYPYPVRDLVVNTSDMTVDFVKLILVPAWLTYFVTDGKRFAALVNGQNGLVTVEKEPSSIGLWIKKILT